ncbi:sensor domain-containing protein [Leeia oryzae]|uniref:sensor domain-containing protein n=1 Tax=Leeia oryzae TaxID=356662 RepID=UPI00035F8D53|nr:EAL domain-containing protein [Leeia oryzae]
MMDGTQIPDKAGAALDESSIARLLLLGSGIGTWVWNIQTGETRFNERWAQIIGYTLAELGPTSIDTWVKYTHPDDLALSNQMLQRHFSGLDAHYECEARMRHKDGHWVKILDMGQVLVWDDQGKPLWMFGSHLDITSKWLAEQSHDELLDRLQRLSAHLPGFLYQYRVRPDGTSHFPFATPGISAVYGCTPEDVAQDAAPVFAVLHPDDIGRVAASIHESAKTLTPWIDRYRVCHPVRGVLWVEGNAGPEKEADGSIIWHGYLRDVTLEQMHDEQLKLLSTVFAASQQGIMIVDAQVNIVEVNDAFTRITGYTREEVLGKQPSLLSSGRQTKDFYHLLWSDVSQKGRWQGEIWNRRKSGEIYAELLSIDTVKDEQGHLQNYVAIFTDISQIKAYQNELERIAHFDVLTGLPNRRLLGDRLEMAINHARSRGELVAVSFLDLDGFKAINDYYGHAIGDHVLVVLAERMRKVIRGHDTISRIGGDEFVLLMTEIHSYIDALEIIERVLVSCSEPITLPDSSDTVSISASIGVALYPDIQFADELLRCADQAMYRAKQQGRNCFVLFDATKEDAQRERHQLLRQIESALENHEFELFYQPKINVMSGLVRSTEALIRWRQPDGSYRAPGEFIDVMYGYPVELKVGRWVIETAVRQYHEWHSQGLTLPVSINVSVDHLLSKTFVGDLATILKQYQIAHPEHLTLEILETSQIDDFQRVRERLLDCKVLGVRFSLDDFGTGYSSLTYMRQLPVDALKIDQSFVKGMLSNPEDESIVQGIIALAHAFDRVAIAEGVETLAHLQSLRALHCDAAQGYGIARPMPALLIPEWVASWNHSLETSSLMDMLPKQGNPP